MTRSGMIAFIQATAGQADAFDLLEAKAQDLSRDAVAAELLHCGIIPEEFAHDSSEEKQWAKYCDILLSRAFNLLDISSEVIRVRGDSADIRGSADGYSIVADAKAFRLSRTAKNQKDFKVTALDDWRRGNTYACLVAPWYQYPSRRSQVYAQAQARNVTLLAYFHLRFLQEHRTDKSLEPLWNCAGAMSPSQDARLYWEAIDDTVLSITESRYSALRTYRQTAAERMSQVALEGIRYWESVKSGYRNLSRDEAISKLIRAERIDQKIAVIRKSADRASKAADG